MDSPKTCWKVQIQYCDSQSNIVLTRGCMIGSLDEFYRKMLLNLYLTITEWRWICVCSLAFERETLRSNTFRMNFIFLSASPTLKLAVIGCSWLIYFEYRLVLILGGFLVSNSWKSFQKNFCVRKREWEWERRWKWIEADRVAQNSWIWNELILAMLESESDEWKHLKSEKKK